MLKLFFASVTLLISVQVAASDGDLELLKERVKERWSVLEGHDFGELYKYETPNYRSIFTKKMFINRYSSDVTWRDIKVEDVEYDSDDRVATVGLSLVTASASAPVVALSDVRVFLKERWLFESGTWWYGGMGK